jgi:hypothetical protein
MDVSANNSNCSSFGPDEQIYFYAGKKNYQPPLVLQTEWSVNNEE